ncbi:deoxycytidinylate deaminase [Achromobacter phage 83-24]|uniref:tRNA-specific adenosine deaminase n=1 Tax=Achromobacter phage 83-24 TaxID=1589747 RepID=A0A0B5A1W4_9CAUD|nr:deoxycytidinylate deaminase [Achromobacter phage 83-24]AJD82868.1 tRNA-specific adenosine deaminase [Achromobacter phage 83-24]
MSRVIGALDWGSMNIKPEQTSQYKWDKRFIQMAHLVKGWSKDERKVGAVIVQDRKIIGMGYNGFPSKVLDQPDRYASKDVKRGLIIHAELNAIFDVETKMLLEDATLYATRFPCNECMKALSQVRIGRIVSPPPEVDHPVWGESHKFSLLMMHESGITFTEMS